MGVVVLAPKYAKLGQGYSRREQIQALEHPGRRANGTQTAASWLSDLVELRKLILLCRAWCAPKFNPRKHRYRKFYSADWTGKTDGYTHNGKCDGCKQNTALLPGGGVSFVAEETYKLLCIDPVEARRRARQAARAAGLIRIRVRSITRGSAAPFEGRARKGA